MLPDNLSTSPQSQLKERNKRIWKQIWCSPLILFIYFWATLFFSILFYLGYQRAEIYNQMPYKYIGGIRSFYYNWFFNRSIDLSDDQWFSLRQFLPALFAGAIVFVSLRRVLCYVSRNNKFASKIFYLLFSLGFLLFLHKTAIVFPLFFAACSFCIGKYFKQDKKNIIVSWIFNSAIRVLCDYYNGFPFVSLLFWDSSTGYWLDQLRGVLAWQTYYNIMLCRLISFNIDYYDFCNNTSTTTPSPIPPKQFTTTHSEHRFRQEQSIRKEEDFSFLNFCVYVFYVPLYIGGPICGFKAFISYVEDGKQTEFGWKKIFHHTLRLLCYILALEIFLHYNYSMGFAMNDYWNGWESAEFPRMKSYEVAAMGLSLLTFTYLKFLIIWRFFRVWALADGINPPENMNRCIFNSYSLSMFWRSWHRSLYIWIVTYLYKPLGGSKHKLRNAVIVFFFIAVWHDLWMRWISWAFFNLIVMALEIGVTQFFSQKKWQWIKDHPLYTPAYCILMTCSLVLIIFSNLGLFFGFYRSYQFIQIVFFNGWESVITVCFIFLFLPFGVRFSVAQREYEAAMAIEKTNY